MANKNIFVEKAKFLGGQEAISAIKHQFLITPKDVFTKEEVITYLSQVENMFETQLAELIADFKLHPLGD